MERNTISRERDNKKTTDVLSLGSVTPYHSPKLHPGPCNSVGMRRGTDRHTCRQTCV